MGVDNVLCKLADAQVAGVRAGSARGVRAETEQGVQGSCRGQGATSASVSALPSEGCEGQAEVAEVSDSLTRARAHTRAHAHARAREQRIDAGPVQTPQPLHVPGPVTLLKHCRCADCLRSKVPAGSSLACPLPHVCLPQPDEWHYCAEYHGPQISKDVWAWPRSRHAEVAEVSRDAPGPSGSPSEKNRRENGTGAGLFRSAARTPGQEVHQP